MMNATTATSPARLFAWLTATACALTLTIAGAASPGATSSSDGAADTKALQQEWSEAVAALKNYSAAQRDQAIDEAGQTLAAMDARIDRLDARARNEWAQLSENVRQRREATLQALKRERNELAEWYGAMKHSSGDAWENVKQGFIDAYGVLGDSFSKARAEFDNDEGAQP